MSDLDAIASAAGSPQVHYRSPQRTAPKYRAITLGAALIWALAILNLFVGVLIMPFAIASQLEAWRTAPHSLPLAVSWMPLIWSASFLVVGALIAMVAAIAEAIRDIAVNSFRW